MPLGERIAYLRKVKGLRQKDFAKLVGVHPAHVSRWERGHMSPSSDALSKIASALEMTVDELVSAQESFELQDPQLLRSFHQAQELPQEDKAIVVRLVEALSTKQRMEKVLQGSPA
jgi:transcriptional regulator with XRE-family HTH domain